MSDSVTTTYLRLATKTAQKLGRNGGGISYKVLADTDRQHLYLTIVGNDGGGYVSRDVVAFENVEACLPADPAQPLAAKVFARAFTGKSANNPGFMAAILRSEGLLGPVEGKAHLHQVAGDWPVWKAAMLALNGEVYAPASPVLAAPEMTRQEHPAPHDAEYGSPRRTGGKRRVAKAADETDHAHPA